MGKYVFSYFKDIPIEMQKKKEKKKEKKISVFLNTLRRNKNYWRQDVRYTHTTASLINDGASCQRQTKTKTRNRFLETVLPHAARVPLRKLAGCTPPPSEITATVFKCRHFPFKNFIFWDLQSRRENLHFLPYSFPYSFISCIYFNGARSHFVLEKIYN